MQTHFFKNKIPEYYRINEADWYNHLLRFNEGFLRRVIVIIFITALLIPIAFSIDDYITKDHILWLNYMIPFCIIFVLLILFLLGGKTAIFRYIVVVICFLGFWSTLFLPHTREIYRLIFYSFPILTVLLLGRRKAAIWLLLVPAITVLLFIFWQIGIQYPLQYTYKLLPFSISYATYTVISFFIVLVDRKVDAYAYEILKNQLYDSSTGFPNRSMLEFSIPQEDGTLLGILHLKNHSELITLWNFSEFDKRFKEVLLYLSQMQKIMVFRLNINEIAFIFPSSMCKKKSAKTLISGVHDYVSCIAFSHVNFTFNPDFRLGAVVLYNDTSNSALRKANIALSYALINNYKYKKYSPDIDSSQKHIQNLQKYKFLREAILENRNEVLYQPVFDSNGNIEFFEALFRLKDKNGRLVSIGEYLKIAETTGMDENITDFVVREASSFINKTGSSVSINLSLSDMRRNTVLEKLFLLVNAEFHHKIIIELLEIADMELDSPLIRQFFLLIKSFGFKSAIDDFGTGYSNLDRIVKLPVEYVKIDGSLVQSIRQGSHNLQLLEGICRFCNNLGKKVVAEWVDAGDLILLLEELDVYLFQGFYLSKPLVKKEALKVINKTANGRN